MEIALFSNVANHYMIPLIEELNSVEGVKAIFVETEPLPDSLKKGGFSVYDGHGSIIHAWKSRSEWDKAMDLAVTADVMMLGSAPEDFIMARLKKGLFTFKCSERPLKNGFFRELYSVLIYQYRYFRFYRNKPVYMLCYSAFAARDYNLMGTFIGKCFKFGYLPRIKEQDVNVVLSERKKAKKIRMIWCARFLDWKHPELPVLLAKKLLSGGYDFEINMIGSGEEFERTEKLIQQLQVQDHVHLLGNFPNEEVLNMMKEHHIFLFTSDRGEGWGVVLNEAMGQLCCPVSSHLAGATPYLVNHKENGLIFRSGDIDSLYKNVKYLLDNQDEIYRLSVNAYKTVNEIWNPSFVAGRFLKLCESLQRGEPTPFSDGPCSPSTPRDGIVSFSD